MRGRGLESDKEGGFQSSKRDSLESGMSMKTWNCCVLVSIPGVPESSLGGAGGRDWQHLRQRVRVSHFRGGLILHLIGPLLMMLS